MSLNIILVAFAIILLLAIFIRDIILSKTKKKMINRVKDRGDNYIKLRKDMIEHEESLKNDAKQ